MGGYAGTPIAAKASHRYVIVRRKKSGEYKYCVIRKRFGGNRPITVAGKKYYADFAGRSGSKRHAYGADPEIVIGPTKPAGKHGKQSFDVAANEEG